MSRKQERAAHAYAVRALRRLGRDFTTGEWSESFGPLSAPDALRVMARAAGTVARLGVASVVNAIDEALADALLKLTGE